MICPFCNQENIPGADECERCMAPLTDLSRPRARSPIERKIHRDRIAVLHPREPVVVAPNTPISQVLQIMVQHNVGCVVVARGREAVGIFSERDVLSRLGNRAKEALDKPVGDYMTPTPETLKASDRIAFALQKMDVNGYRHLPVTNDDGELVGVISVRDILRYVSDNLFETEAV